MPRNAESSAAPDPQTVAQTLRLEKKLVSMLQSLCTLSDAYAQPLRKLQRHQSTERNPRSSDDNPAACVSIPPQTWEAYLNRVKN